MEITTTDDEKCLLSQYLTRRSEDSRGLDKIKHVGTSGKKKRHLTQGTGD